MVLPCHQASPLARCSGCNDFLEVFVFEKRSAEGFLPRRICGCQPARWDRAPLWDPETSAYLSHLSGRTPFASGENQPCNPDSGCLLPVPSSFSPVRVFFFSPPPVMLFLGGLFVSEFPLFLFADNAVFILPCPRWYAIV